MISQNLLPKRQLTKGIFPSGNFPDVQFLKRQLPKSVLAAALLSVLDAALSTLVCSSRTARPPIAAGGALQGLA